MKEKYTYIRDIGGHGFWGRGGVYTGGRRHRGVEIFFQGGILLVDPPHPSPVPMYDYNYSNLSHVHIYHFFYESKE